MAESIRAEAERRGVSVWRVRSDRGEKHHNSGRQVRRSTGIRMPRELHDRLREASADRDLSINFLVVKAVEEFLDHLIPPDELRLTRRSDASASVR